MQKSSIHIRTEILHRAQERLEDCVDLMPKKMDAMLKIEAQDQTEESWRFMRSNIVVLQFFKDRSINIVIAI